MRNFYVIFTSDRTKKKLVRYSWSLLLLLLFLLMMLLFLISSHPSSQVLLAFIAIFVVDWYLHTKAKSKAYECNLSVFILDELCWGYIGWVIIWISLCVYSSHIDKWHCCCCFFYSPVSNNYGDVLLHLQFPITSLQCITVKVDLLLKLHRSWTKTKFK